MEIRCYSGGYFGLQGCIVCFDREADSLSARFNSSLSSWFGMHGLYKTHVDMGLRKKVIRGIPSSIPFARSTPGLRTLDISGEFTLGMLGALCRNYAVHNLAASDV